MGCGSSSEAAKPVALDEADAVVPFEWKGGKDGAAAGKDGKDGGTASKKQKKGAAAGVGSQKGGLASGEGLASQKSSSPQGPKGQAGPAIEGGTWGSRRNSHEPAGGAAGGSAAGSPVVSVKRKPIAEQKKRGLLQRHSSTMGADDDDDAHPATTAGATASTSSGGDGRHSHANVALALSCDGDLAHEAAVWCSACEEHLCMACDAQAHRSKATRGHVRTPLAGAAGAAAAAATTQGQDGGKHSEEKEATPASAALSPQQQRKTKFVVRGAPTTSATPPPGAEGGEAAAAAAPTDVKKSPKFTVARFAQDDGGLNASPLAAAGSAGGGVSGGAGDKDVMRRVAARREQEAADRLGDASLGARLKNAPASAHVLNEIGDSELARMSRAELELLWNKYDRDRHHVLARAELKKLAEDVIVRWTKLIRDDLLRTNPTLSEAELERKLAAERAFTLPGKDSAETQHEIVRMLEENLDLNHDGKITKQEYLASWNAFAHEVFQLKKDGALSCGIM